MFNPIRTIFTGKEIKAPGLIKDVLTEGETVLHTVQQARIRQFITPDNIVITNKRVIFYRPKMFGLRKNIEDYKFIDMANTVVDQGIIQANIKIKMRFQPTEVLLRGIPKYMSAEIFKDIQEGISGKLGELEPSSPIPTMPSPPGEQIPQEPEMSKEEMLSKIQSRYVSGDISKKEYEFMKNELMENKEQKKRFLKK